MTAGVSAPGEHVSAFLNARPPMLSSAVLQLVVIAFSCVRKTLDGASATVSVVSLARPAPAVGSEEMTVPSGSPLENAVFTMTRAPRSLSSWRTSSTWRPATLGIVAGVELESTTALDSAAPGPGSWSTTRSTSPA